MRAVLNLRHCVIKSQLRVVTITWQMMEAIGLSHHPEFHTRALFELIFVILCDANKQMIKLECMQWTIEAAGAPTV